MITSARRILAATLFLAAALALAQPAKAGINQNGWQTNGLAANGASINGLHVNALTAHGTAPRGFGAGTAVDVNKLHLVSFILPDGRALPAAAR